MKRYFSYITAGLFLLTVIGGACRDDDFVTAPDSHNSLQGGMKVKASIFEPESTRSYFASGATSSGPVQKGKFYLAYPYSYGWQTGDAYGHEFYFYYHYATVNFGFSGEETTGFVNRGTPTVPQELIWSSSNSSSNEGIIYYPAKTSPSPMFLDNMPFVVSTTATVQRDSILVLNTLPEGNPFVPGVFDAENGTNDLLWGTANAYTPQDFIEFELYHRMTRLNITVNVDNTEEDGYRTSLKKAKMWIEGLLLEPKTYLRKYGELRFEERLTQSTIASTIPEDEYNTKFTLVEGHLDEDTLDDASSEDDIDSEDQWNSLTWLSEPDDVATEIQTYKSKDFVFVPQTLRQGATTRPRLVIQVPIHDVNSGYNPDYNQDYIYYSGNLPYTMMLPTDDGSEARLTLDFLKGYVINLTTKLKPGEPELIFAPVTVEPWVWKGTFNPDSRQAGIFNPTDLYNLVKYYRENNSFWLGRYGFIASADAQTGTWTFQFNSGNLDLEVDKIMGLMHPGEEKEGPNEETVTPPFKFDFRGRNQNYVMPNGEKIAMGTTSSSAQILYNIVTAERGSGVTNEDEFTNLIDAYQTNNWTLFQFGEFNYKNDEIVPGEGDWIFDINNNLSFDYEDIVAQMIPDEENFISDFEFNIADGATVSVDNYPGISSQPMEITNGNPEILYQIVSKREPGFYSPEQFAKLMDLYNSNLDLEAFTPTTSGTLVFPMWRSMYLISQNIQGGMKAKNDKPYEFNLQNNQLNLLQYDGSTDQEATAINLYTLVNLNKVSGIGTEEVFKDMISAYTSNTGAAPAISTYGYYCFKPERWNFSITAPITLKRSEIAGKMIRQAGQLDISFSFNRNGVYIMDDDDNYILLSGTEGEEELVKILTTNPEDVTQP